MRFPMKVGNSVNNDIFFESIPYPIRETVDQDAAHTVPIRRSGFWILPYAIQRPIELCKKLVPDTRRLHFIPTEGVNEFAFGNRNEPDIHGFLNRFMTSS